jgi:hypothetical protein
VEDGLKFVEKHAKEFPNDAVFTYNQACTYSRALEAVLKDEKAENREARADTYRKRALEELAASLKHGFNDKKLLGEDPDLDPLRKLPEFQKIVPASKRDGSRKLDGSDKGKADAAATEGEEAATDIAIP